MGPPGLRDPGDRRKSDYDPGPDYYDIAALDVYDGGYERRREVHHDAGKALAEKPIAIGECETLRRARSSPNSPSGLSSCSGRTSSPRNAPAATAALCSAERRPRSIACLAGKPSFRGYLRLAGSSAGPRPLVAPRQAASATRSSAALVSPVASRHSTRASTSARFKKSASVTAGSAATASHAALRRRSVFPAREGGSSPRPSSARSSAARSWRLLRQPRRVDGHPGDLPIRETPRTLLRRLTRPRTSHPTAQAAAAVANTASACVRSATVSAAATTKSATPRRALPPHPRVSRRDRRHKVAGIGTLVQFAGLGPREHEVRLVRNQVEKVDAPKVREDEDVSSTTAMRPYARRLRAKIMALISVEPRRAPAQASRRAFCPPASDQRRHARARRAGVSNEGPRHAYRDDLAAAYERIATLERELAARSSEDPDANLLASGWSKSAPLIAASGPTKLTRAQRALPNVVTIPFGAFAFGSFLIGLWWLALLTILLAVAISWGVRALVRWHADADRRVRPANRPASANRAAPARLHARVNPLSVAPLAPALVLPTEGDPEQGGQSREATPIRRPNDVASEESGAVVRRARGVERARRRRGVQSTDATAAGMPIGPSAYFLRLDEVEEIPVEVSKHRDGAASLFRRWGRTERHAAREKGGVVAPEIIRLEKEKHAPPGLVPDARLLLRRRGSREQEPGSN